MEQRSDPLTLAALLGLALTTLTVCPAVNGLPLLPWATAGATAVSLLALGTPVTWQGDLLHHAGGFVAQVHRDCTVLWMAWILLGGLAVLLRILRSAPRHTLGWMLVGVLAMAMVNQVRLIAVIWLAVHAPDHYEFVHQVLAPGLQLVAIAGYLATVYFSASLCPRRRSETSELAFHGGRE